MARKVYLGDAIALTEKQFINARKRYYRMVTRRKVSGIRKVY